MRHGNSILTDHCHLESFLSSTGHVKSKIQLEHFLIKSINQGICESAQIKANISGYIEETHGKIELIAVSPIILNDASGLAPTPDPRTTNAATAAEDRESIFDTPISASTAARSHLGLCVLLEEASLAQFG